MSDSVTYAFATEWFDARAQQVRSFTLIYYDGGVSNGMLELVDTRNNKAFVKKVLYPSITLDMLFVGASLVVNGRQLTVCGYADVATRRACEQRDARQVLLVLPAGYNQTGEALGAVERAGYKVRGVAMARLGAGEAAKVAAAAAAAAAASSGGAGAGDGEEVRASDLTADAVTAVAAEIFFGGDGGEGGDSSASASAAAKACAVFDNCTLCLVRPTVVARGGAGAVVDAILTDGGFEISAVRMVHLDRPQASELLDVYRGVPGVPYEAALRELASGPLLAVQVRGQDVVNTFREFTGPYCVEVARALAPDSLRARFGSREAGDEGFAGDATNGVHCTDLPEDGVLECRYMFEVLD